VLAVRAADPRWFTVAARTCRGPQPVCRPGACQLWQCERAARAAVDVVAEVVIVDWIVFAVSMGWIVYRVVVKGRFLWWKRRT
jgi:hypothetical protein